MDCKHIREQLHQSLDGAPASSALRDHLAACAACRAELTAMRLTAAALGALPRAVAPAGLMAGVMAAVRQQPLADVQARRQRQALGLLAATLALLASLLLAVAAGDVWVTLTTPPEDSGIATTEQAAVTAAVVDPVAMAEQLPAAAESGGVPFLAGLCLLFVAGATALLSLLVPVTRPPVAAENSPMPSSFQLS